MGSSGDRPDVDRHGEAAAVFAEDEGVAGAPALALDGLDQRRRILEAMGDLGRATVAFDRDSGSIKDRLDGLSGRVIEVVPPA